MGKPKRNRAKTKDSNNINFDNSNNKLSPITIRIEKNKIRNKNPDVFHFNLDSNYIYEPRYCSFFYKKLSNPNSMKPSMKDITNFAKFLELEKILDNSDNTKENINIPKYFAEYFINMRPINIFTDIRIIRIKHILDGLYNTKFSLRKLSELYRDKYKQSLSKTTIHRTLRNKLGLHFLKTCPKNDILLSKESIKQTFFVLKVLSRHIKFGGNIIYIDESTFSTDNNNYKSWRKPNSQIYKKVNDSKKINLILAVSQEKIIHWLFIQQNTTSEIFKNFFVEMIDKMKDSDLKKSLFFLDNAAIHGTLEMMKIYSDKKLKILFNVPYLSFFNMVELVFRSLKNIVYNKLFSSIKEIENILKDLLKSEKLKSQLVLLYNETINQYIKFVKDNINYNIS